MVRKLTLNRRRLRTKTQPLARISVYDLVMQRGMNHCSSARSYLRDLTMAGRNVNEFAMYRIALEK